MPEQDITEIDLYRIFKKAIFDVTIELGKPAPSSTSSGLPPTPPAPTASNSLDALNSLLQQAATTNNLLKILASSLLPKEFRPRGFSQKTAQTANAPTQLLPTSIKTSHFIVQNQGTANISWGSQTERTITIASGAMFLYSFTQANYVIDLSETYVSSPSASQPYGVLVFL